MALWLIILILRPHQKYGWSVFYKAHVLYIILSKIQDISNKFNKIFALAWVVLHANTGGSGNVFFHTLQM